MTAQEMTRSYSGGNKNRVNHIHYPIDCINGCQDIGAIHLNFSILFGDSYIVVCGLVKPHWWLRKRLKCYWWLTCARYLQLERLLPNAVVF